MDSIAPLRDLAPSSLPPLKSTFEAWSARCTSVLETLEEEEAKICATAEQRTERQQRVDELFEKKLSQSGEDEKSGRGKRVLDEKDAGAVDEDAMDVDGEGGGSRMKGAKRALMGLLK